MSVGHYENFPVASRLVPAPLRPAIVAIYRFARAADDLADEGDAPADERVAALAAFGRALDAIEAGATPAEPPFPALAEAIRAHRLPLAPFRDLLSAFTQDATTGRYATYVDVLDYCRSSANPVGRLVLYLGRAHDERRGALSDRICTALQLANFCQDVANDFDRGRIYLPRQTLREAGYDEAMFARREFNPSFRRAMEIEVARAESLLRAGLPLADAMPRELQVQIELFARGGLAILDAVRRIDYNVWRRRPRVSKLTKISLLASAWWRRRVFRRTTGSLSAGGIS